VTAAAIRPATSADNGALLELTRRTPMNGRIALRIDRDPDFFALTRHRGKGEVFVATRNEQVIASFSVTLADVLISGTPVRAAYIADLKSAGKDSGRVLLRLFESATRYLRANDVALVWCVVAAGNEGVAPFLDGRAGLPRFAPCGRFFVDELVNIKRRTSSRYTVDLDVHGAEVADLVRRFRATRDLSCEYRGGDVGTIARLAAREGTRVVAALELFDPGSIKRNVLLGAPFTTRALLAIGSSVSAVIGGPPLPRVGDTVRLAYIRNVACDGDRTSALKALIGRARGIALERGFMFSAIGLHERDPLRAAVAGMPRFTFSSLLYATSLGQPSLIEAMQRGVPVQDYSVV
jgi:hypothetical protein